MHWSCRIALVVLAGSLAMAGCASKETDDIRIGVNAEITGSKPTVGDSCQKAAQLMAAQVNAGGGLKVGDKKYPVTLFIEDNEDKAGSSRGHGQKAHQPG